MRGRVLGVLGVVVGLVVGGCAREVADGGRAGGTTTNEYERQWGQACEGDGDAECLAEGLVCEAGACLQACEADAECPEGWVCEPLQALGLSAPKYCGKVCELGAETSCQDLPAYCSDGITEGGDGGLTRPRCAPIF